MGMSAAHAIAPNAVMPPIDRGFSINDETGVLASVRVRPFTANDMPHLCRVYAAARADEMAQCDWSEAEKAAFLEQQFTCQHNYYQEHYTDAQFLVIEREGVAIGRLYWWDEGGHAGLVDISLLPEFRGQGIGGVILSRLTERADRAGQSITLHVEPTNPAHRLYLRHGFFVLANNGVYMQMRRAPREVYV